MTLNISVPAAELEQPELPNSLGSAGWLCLGICTHAALLCSPHGPVSVSPTLTGTSEAVSSAVVLLLQQLSAVHSKFL